VPDRALTSSFRLSIAVAVLVAAQAVSGIAFPGLYRDEAFALNAWRLNDPITLILAVPVLVVALVLVRRGSQRATLVWFGVLQYSIYNYAFYLFGASLNAFFPLYVILFSLSTVALILGLSGLDTEQVTMKPAMPYRRVAGYLGFWAGILAIAWTLQWSTFVFAGREPGIGVDPFRLIAALDLSLVVCPLVLATWWVWRKSVWGVVLAVIMLVKGVLYATLLSAASLPLFGRGWGGDPLLPLWLTLLLGAVVSLVAVLVNVRDDDAPGHSPGDIPPA
jgi:hypothetical protein